MGKATFQATEAPEAMICGRASYHGSLLSITWTTARSVLLFFAGEKRPVEVPADGLSPRRWTTYYHNGEMDDEERVVWSARQNLDEASLEGLGGRRSQPLVAYYLLSVPSAHSPVVIFADAGHAVVARLGRAAASTELPYTMDTNGRLTDKQFAIVHDQSGKDVYGWFIELNFRDAGNRAVLSVYNLWLNQGSPLWPFFVDKPTVDFSAKSKYCHYAVLSEGFLLLSGSREVVKKFENEKTTVQWAVNATHGRPPRGFVDYRTGTLFLVEDEKGCVYSVLAWGRSDLGTSEKGTVKKYRAFGTPFEQFFECWPEHLKQGKAHEKGAPDRCDLGGESEIYREKGYGPGRSTLRIEESEEDVQKSGIRGGGGSGGGAHLLMIFLSVGGALLLLLLVFGLYRKGSCCSKGKSKTVSGKSSKTAKSGKFKSSATSNSSKMMVASKGGAGGGKAMPKSSVGGEVNSSAAGKSSVSSAAGKSSVSSAATPSDYFPSSSAASSTTSSSSKAEK